MNDYLEHHGVKGQRWGIRKAISKSLRNNKTHHNDATKIKPSNHNDATKIKPSNHNKHGTVSSTSDKQKKAKDMSNDELYKAIQRQQLLNQYNALMNPKQPSRIQKATHYLSSIAKVSTDIAKIYKAVHVVNAIKFKNNTKNIDISNNKKNNKKNKGG